MARKQGDKKIRIHVGGMTCASCVARVERAAAMAASSLTVVSNSLRLRRFRPARLAEITS